MNPKALTVSFLIVVSFSAFCYAQLASAGSAYRYYTYVCVGQGASAVAHGISSLYRTLSGHLKKPLAPMATRNVQVANDITLTAPARSSWSVTETVNGSHHFAIHGYSLAKGMGVGKHIASENFTVGGYQWAIYFYPDGKNPEDNSTYVSAFIALASEGTDVRALFELTLVDQSGKGKHKVHSHFDGSLKGGHFTLKYRGSMWRAMLESSDFLKDDCLKFNCRVGVLVSAASCSGLCAIKVPESDIGDHFAILLGNKENSDVIFNVAGEKFHAHKLVMAARSPVVEALLFGGTSNTGNEIFLEDAEPAVFKALLHFIYRDTLNEELLASTSSSASVCETLAAKLLAAADKYELGRLRLICESLLCKDISVNSVAKILALADRYHALELKAVCMKFAAENLVGMSQKLHS